MDKEIAIFKKQLILNSEIKLSEYGIKPSLFFGSSKYNLERLKKSRYIHNQYNSYTWLFSGKSLGNYCRLLHSITTGILEKVNFLITKGDYDMVEISNLVTTPLISDLKILLEKEEEYKTNIQKNSVILNSSSLRALAPIDSILIDSIKRLYDFRNKELMILLNELTRITSETNENYLIKKKIIFSRKFEIEDTPIRSLGTMGFCWNKNRNIIEDLVKFHTFLRELNFIEKDTSIKLLKSGFCCEYIQDPLKIKWTKLVKGKSSKALLFHFIDELEHFNYINIIEQNSELFKKIEYVFCDNQGEKFQNLDVSKSQWLNQRKTGRTPQEFQLDNIMYSISR